MRALEHLVGQLLVVGFESTTPSADVTAEAQRGALGGVILFKRNVTPDPRDVAELNARLAEAWRGQEAPLIAVDQEGGRVARIGVPFLKLPPMLSLEAKSEEFVAALAAEQSRQLRALGFTMNFAPVLDVHSREDNPIIGDRAFGREPEGAARRALAFARGMRDGGLLSCGKHYPGHGDTRTDSHLELPIVDASRDRLERVELAPFRSAARGGVDALMTAHVVYPALDEAPATLSPTIATKLLREELGFEGVLFSDDLEMKALSARMTYGESAVAAITAGCDVLLVCSRADAWREALEGLTREAERSATFRARCEQARDRFVAMRRRCPPAPKGRADLDAVLASTTARRLEDEAWGRA